jgi:hypothetical protein
MYLAGNIAFQRALGGAPITQQAVAMTAALASTALGILAGAWCCVFLDAAQDRRAGGRF